MDSRFELCFWLHGVLRTVCCVWGWEAYSTYLRCKLRVLFLWNKLVALLTAVGEGNKETRDDTPQSTIHQSLISMRVNFNRALVQKLLSVSLEQL